jgi:hypothetical protein
VAGGVGDGEAVWVVLLLIFLPRAVMVRSSSLEDILKCNFALFSSPCCPFCGYFDAFSVAVFLLVATVAAVPSCSVLALLSL